jgi:hypothetical protein
MCYNARWEKAALTWNISRERSIFPSFSLPISIVRLYPEQKIKQSLVYGQQRKLLLLILGAY